MWWNCGNKSGKSWKRLVLTCVPGLQLYLLIFNNYHCDYFDDSKETYLTEVLGNQERRFQVIKLSNSAFLNMCVQALIIMVTHYQLCTLKAHISKYSTLSHVANTITFRDGCFSKMYFSALFSEGVFVFSSFSVCMNSYFFYSMRVIF